MAAHVVPRVGTWIEIIRPVDSQKHIRVVPRVGTWIEIVVKGWENL